MNSYADYVDKPTQDNPALAQLNELANQQRAAELKVEEAQKALKAAQEELRVVKEGTLPTLMDELGLETFKTTDGLEIDVSEKIRAGISKERAPGAFAWLRANGHSKLIKHEVTVQFGKGGDDDAEELAKELATDYSEVDNKQSVHPSTLQAFIKQKLRAGEEIPLELFGVHRQRFAQVKSTK